MPVYLLPFGLLPALGLVVWLSASFTEPVEPYGLYSGRRIGGFTLSGLVMWTGLLPAAGLATGRIGLGVALCVLVYGSWALLFAGQRRHRRPLPRDAWTDAVIDRARVHHEYLPIGGLWCCGFAVGVVADPSHWVQWLGFVAGSAALTAFGAYSSVLANGRRETRLRRFAITMFWVTSAGLVIAPVAPLVRFAVLILGVPLATWAAERVRRTTIRVRWAELVASGDEAALRARYGQP